MTAASLAKAIPGALTLSVGVVMAVMAYALFRNYGITFWVAWGMLLVAIVGLVVGSLQIIYREESS